MPYLEDESGARWPLTKPLTTIGSSPESDVRLAAERGAEPDHAIVVLDGSGFEVRSAARGATLLVNNKKKKRATLAHNDRLACGEEALRFVLLDEVGGDERAGADRSDRFALKGLRRVHEFSIRVLGGYDVDEILAQMIDAVIELVGAQKGFILLAAPGGWEVKVARDVDRATIADALAEVPDSIVSRVAQTRAPLVVSDAVHDAQFGQAHSVINLQLASVMCAPLVANDRVLGVIYLGNERVASLFERRHVELLSIFASTASLVLANALAVRDLKEDRDELERRLDGMRFGSIIGACDRMRAIYRTVEKVAPTDVSVLITGETGTGKELIAHEIHARSPRSRGPFVAINCGAIPEGLLESELFGHVRGAFTGASAARTGRFQAADGGTIFLDEIGEMPGNLQVKLLRVLQERSITKVGASKPEPVDIRVIAATHIDLDEAVGSGAFREDLFYRLNVVRVALPALRERGEDVVVIGRYLVHKISEELGLAPRDLSAATCAAMMGYEWPGNIRQLENRIKKALVLADGPTISPVDLELDVRPAEQAGPMTLAEAKERFAMEYVREALERHGGNRTRTAAELGVDPRTIFRYLEKIGEAHDEA